MKASKIPKYLIAYVFESDFDFLKRSFLKMGCRSITYEDPERKRNNVQELQDQLVAKSLYIIQPILTEDSDLFSIELKRTFNCIATDFKNDIATAEAESRSHIPEDIQLAVSVGETGSTWHDYKFEQSPIKSILQCLVWCKNVGRDIYENQWISLGSVSKVFDRENLKSASSGFSCDISLKLLDKDLGLYKYRAVSNGLRTNSGDRYVQIEEIF